jgi:hypothetical protein
VAPRRALRFDAAYHARLSADALPALLAAAPTLPVDDCLALREQLGVRWRSAFADTTGAPAGRDWRALDLARARAIAWVDAGALTPCAGGR